MKQLLLVALLFISAICHSQVPIIIGAASQNRVPTAGGGAGTPQTLEIDNAVVGSAPNQNNYQGTWAHLPKAMNFMGTQSVSTTNESYVEMSCTCYKIEWWSEKYPWHGIAGVSIDGGSETNVDQYAAEEEPTQLLFSSGTLTNAIHTIRLRVTGNKNVANVSDFNYLVHDFFRIYYYGVPPTPGGGGTNEDDLADYVVAQNQAGASDSNPGTPAQPFLTISRAAQVAQPGDFVLIKEGVYRETIVPINSGTPGNDITYKGASGQSVVVSGLNTVSTSWSNVSGEVYRTAITLPRTGHSSTLTTNTTLLANQVFKGSSMQFEASTRAISTVNDLFDKTKWKALSTANFQPTNATDAIFSGKSLTGATAVIQGWFAVDSRTISSQSSNTINYPQYSDNTGTGMQYRRWIYVTNDLDLLDAAGEWHYDGTWLYLWQTGGGSPTGIQYKARNWAFDLRSKSRIAIRNITFIGAEPVTGNDATSYVTVDNIRSTYANHSVTHQTYRWQGVGMTRQVGLKLTGTNNVLKNSEISYASTQGVWIGANGRIENNYIHHIGYDGGWGAGVDLWGEEDVNNITITKNTIAYTARSSVSLGYAFAEFIHRKTTNLDISYNDFSKWCLFSDDGGALYTWGFRDHTGSVVHHNWFHDAGFVLNPLNLPQSGRLDGIAVAFYTDQGAGPFSVHHNVFWNNVESFSGDAADVYTQPTFQGGAGGFRNNGGSKFYNNTFWSNAPWTGKSNPNNTPPEPFRNNIMRKTWTFFPSSSPDLGSENSNIYNGSPAPLFAGGSLSAPQNYFQLQAGSPAVNTGIVISGITGSTVGTPDKGAYERGAAAWIPGYVAVSDDDGGVVGAGNIASLAAVTNINVPYNTVFGTNGVGVGLPAAINCTFDGGGTGTVPMSWAIGSYDKDDAVYSNISYTIVGTPVTSDGITNSNSITRSVNVMVRTPFTPLTSGIAAIYDISGLAVSTTNAFGTVDGSSNITAVKSLAPGPLGRDLDVRGTAPKLSSGVAAMLGTGNFKQSTTNSDLEFLWYNATPNNLKWTVVVIGNLTDTNEAFNGIIGNNGFQGSNTGMSLSYKADGSSNTMILQVTGNGGWVVDGTFSSGNPIAYGTESIYTFQLDYSQTVSNKTKLWRGVTPFTTTESGVGLPDNATPDTVMNFGDMGTFGGADMLGSIRMIVILQGVETSEVLSKFISDLSTYTGVGL